MSIFEQPRIVWKVIGTLGMTAVGVYYCLFSHLPFPPAMRWYIGLTTLLMLPAMIWRRGDWFEPICTLPLPVQALLAAIVMAGACPVTLTPGWFPWDTRALPLIWGLFGAGLYWAGVKWAGRSVWHRVFAQPHGRGASSG